MPEIDSIPQETLQQVERIGSADIVLGILSGGAADSADPCVAMVPRALERFATPPRAVILRAGAPPSNPQGGENPAHCISCPPLARDAAASIIESIARGYRAVFWIAGRLGARACAVIASDLTTVGPQWITQLVQPVLEESFDLVAPVYSHRKFEGLINSGFVYPLMRALYGKRIENPMGPDFGFSGPLAALVLRQDSKTRTGTTPNIMASFSTEAVCGDFRVCQTNLGVRLFPPADWMNLSSLLAEILGPLFLDMERRAPYWQKMRGSQPIAQFGDRVGQSEESRAVDVSRPIDSFRLACRNLMDLWSVLLPPSMLLEIQKLARLENDRFRMPDELWARIVYDFALGHRLKVISRDHLLRAITPLYLGWAASWVLGFENSGSDGAEARIERLALAFETAKPYLLSRWRWPDRFNP